MSVGGKPLTEAEEGEAEGAAGADDAHRPPHVEEPSEGAGRRPIGGIQPHPVDQLAGERRPGDGPVDPAVTGCFHDAPEESVEAQAGDGLPGLVAEHHLTAELGEPRKLRDPAGELRGEGEGGEQPQPVPGLLRPVRTEGENGHCRNQARGGTARDRDRRERGPQAPLSGKGQRGLVNAQCSSTVTPEDAQRKPR